MNRPYQRYQRLMERMDTDEEFQVLSRQRQESEQTFYVCLEALPPDNREAVLAYIDACEAQVCRVLELAFDTP